MTATATKTQYEMENPLRQPVVSVRSLPRPHFARWHRGHIQPFEFAAYFRRLLQSPRYRNAHTVSVPSPVELAGFFGCSEQVIFQGFAELQRQGYEYEIRGLDAPIKIRDPRGRNRRNVRNWQDMSQELLKPWDMVRLRTRNPLDTKSYMSRL